MSKILNRIERGAEKLFLEAIGVKRPKRNSWANRWASKKKPTSSPRRRSTKGAGPVPMGITPNYRVISKQGREDFADGSIGLWMPRRLFNEQSKWSHPAQFEAWEDHWRDHTLMPLMVSEMKDVDGQAVQDVWFVQVTPENHRLRFDSDNGMRACKLSMRDPIARFFGRDDADHMPGSIQWNWGWMYGDGFGVLAVFRGEALELADPIEGHIYVPRLDGTELGITYRKRL